MGLQLEQSYVLGGVDSRSSCLNMPANRCLRCLNWAPQEAGFLQLRYGYTEVSMEDTTALAIHSMIHFKSQDGNQDYILYGQGTQLTIHNLATGEQTTPTVRGAAITGTGEWMWGKVGGRIHGTNGTVMKWFDGTTLRDFGIRALTEDDVKDVEIASSVAQFTESMRQAVQIATPTGGTFDPSNSGHYVYVVLFDITTNERGPSVLPVGAGRAVMAYLDKIALTFVQHTATTFPNCIKLLAITEDGGLKAYFCTETSTDIIDITRSSTTATVHATGHGLSVGDPVIISDNTESAYNELWAVVSVPDADHVTFTLPSATGITGTGGKIKRVVFMTGATTSKDILDPTYDKSIIANENRGLAESSIATTNIDGGYDFYACIYNPTTGHVGNRTKIATKYNPTAFYNNTTRANFTVTGLPDLSSEDSEWRILVGRTGDAGQIPYVLTDQAGNWQYSAADGTFPVITEALADENYELPSRNTVPPVFDKLVRAGDRLYGTEANSPYIRRSASEADANQGIFVGKPEQSWAANDLETFPTGDNVTCIAENDLELWCFTIADMAVLINVATAWQWRGPWNVGCAGKKAFTKTPYGPFWVTGEKQLASVSNGEPYAVSSEYETALLSQIGDAYLSKTRVAYIRDVVRHVDCVVIKALKDDGTPFQVYHDFKLRDGQSPMGQGYESVYQGQLAEDYIIEPIRDANEKLRIWAGGSNGRFYQLFDGDNDDGNEYDADWITLVNPGEDRIAVKEIRWRGDRNLGVSIGRTLKTQIASGGEGEFSELVASGSAQAVFGTGDDQFYYLARNNKPEVRHTYVRLQLTSHSDDGGTLALSNPPHIPVENYGRVYAIMVAIKDPRGA